MQFEFLQNRRRLEKSRLSSQPLHFIWSALHSIGILVRRRRVVISRVEMVLQGSRLYIRAILAGSFGFVTFGWDAGVLGGILLTPEFQSAIGVSFVVDLNYQIHPGLTSPQNPTDAYRVSMVTSVFLLASWLGCMIITSFGMRLGRKKWIMAGNVIEIIGTIISATSFSYGQLGTSSSIAGILHTNRYKSRVVSSSYVRHKISRTEVTKTRALEMGSSHR